MRCFSKMKTTVLLMRQFVFLVIMVWIVCALLSMPDIVVTAAHKRPFQHQKTEDRHNNEMERDRKDSLNYKIFIDDLNKRRVPQNDMELIDLIRGNFIQAPSNLPYNLSNPRWMRRSDGQVPYVDRQLKFMEHGFFLECGAYDGETQSNTLWFERVRHWTGLLVEADPENYRQLMSKHRKAYTVNACLNTNPYPASISFLEHGLSGRAVHNAEVEDWVEKQNVKGRLFQVQCFPLYSILLAINRTKIDYLSLDVEGDELYILQTIPFEKVDITMISAEHKHDKSGPQGIESFMSSKGYEKIGSTLKDSIFYKNASVLQ